MPELPPEIPAVFGEYDVIAEVGRGPNGYVCRVRDREGREYAAKVLDPRYAADAARCQRFVREAHVARSLAHPHVVRVHRVVSQFDAPLPFYLMDYHVGGHAGQFRGGDAARIVPLLADVCDALAYVHSRRFIHFDVKPPNILIGAGGTAYLSDFGTTATAAEGTPQGGTLPYMAPEHLAGGQADHRADVYSAGVVLYELLSGALPFSASNARALEYLVRHSGGPPRSGRAADMPDDLWAVVSYAMAPDADDRFPTAAALAAALREVRGRLLESVLPPQ